jgi:inhibitor of KinA sporulation pathway (predicted exonuclease)
MKTNKLIIIDLEATCIENQTADFVQEIIQIGIAVYNTKIGKTENCMGFLVRPNDIDISEYCTNLTGITRDMLVSEGHPLREVLNTIKKLYPIKTRPWCSWGLYDRIQLMSECSAKRISYPFSENHFDLKSIYAIFRGLSNGVGLQKAIEMEDMTFDGTPHSAMWDVFNTSKIASAIFYKR